MATAGVAISKPFHSSGLLLQRSSHTGSARRAMHSMLLASLAFTIVSFVGVCGTNLPRTGEQTAGVCAGGGSENQPAAHNHENAQRGGLSHTEPGLSRGQLSVWLACLCAIVFTPSISEHGELQ